MFTVLLQHRLRWLGHVRRIEEGRIAKYILYGELIAGKRDLGRPQLRYRDVWNQDMEVMNIDLNKREKEVACKPL